VNGLAAALAALAFGLGGAATGAEPDPGGHIAISVTIPRAAESAAPGAAVQLVNARLDWGFNLETRGKSYYGDCNFLMAGVPGTDGDAGEAHQWGLAGWGAGLYHAQSGNAEVVGADGATPVAFEDRCLDPAGEPVRYDAADRAASTYTATMVRLQGGEGWRDPDTGATQIAWSGSFTVVYYDGLTYFTLTDPQLTITADGVATLTATAGGWGSPRDGGAWGRHPDTEVVLVEAGSASSTGSGDVAEGVFPSESGVVVRHAYANRAIVTPAGASPQKLGDASTTPGAWPQSFVDFQGLTGLHSYWYSSGAAIDYRKPPDAVYVSWDAARPIASTAGSQTPPGESTTGAWRGGVATAAGSSTNSTQGGDGGAETVDAADPWDSSLRPVVYSKARPDLVPSRQPVVGASPAAKAAVFTLLVSALTALLAWRRGWFRHRPKGIIS
jgi:hypothetical protein